MRAGIYTRLSPRPDGDYEGTESQLNDCGKFADVIGWTIAEHYGDDDGVSAVADKPRKRFEQLLADIEAGKINAVLATHPDRLYRKLADLLRLCRLCEQHELSIRFVRAGDMDVSTATGRLVAKLLGVINEYEGELKAERWRVGYRRHRENGEPRRSGRRMFGYTRDGEVIPSERDVIRDAAAKLIAGVSLNAVCRDLNDRGVPTVTGIAWEPLSIKGSLTNPIQAGHSTLYGEIVGRGNWEPNLDEDTWQTVRSLLTARTRRQPPRVALLPRLIFCTECETGLVTGGDSAARRTYRCPTRPRVNGCGKVSVLAVPVEEIVEGVARRRLSDPRIRRVIAEAQAAGHDHLLTELDAQQRQLAELEDALTAGGRHVQMVLRAADAITARIDTLERELAAVATVDIPDDVDVDWPTELGARRRLVDLVVARVWVDRATRRGEFDPARVRVEPTHPGEPSAISR